MNVTTILIAVVAGLVALGAAGAKGYSLGADHVKAEYAARDLKAQAEAAALTKATEEKYRAQEQAHSQAVAQIANDYEGRLTDAQRKTTIALDAIRAGGLRLRDPGAQACRDPAASVAASTSGRNGAESGRLSGAASEFLLSEAARADAVVLQLTACQGVVTADRN